MARISTYDQDGTLNKLDKVLGSDSATGDTKNYTINSVVGLINDEDLINIFDSATYTFKSYEAGSTTPKGIINLNAGTATQAAFSSINQIYISVLDKQGDNIADYLDDTVNSFIRIVKKGDINVYGVFKVTAIANHDSNAYKLLTVTPQLNNGNISPNEEYFTSNYSAVFDQDFSDNSITEFGDVTSAGSGAIITTTERNNLTNLNTNALLHADVVDNVTTTTADVPLSANQGKVLKDLIDAINTLLTSDNVNLDSLQEVVDFIEANKSTLDNLSISNVAGLQAALDAKQNTETGKGLSANDFTTTLLNKLNGIATGAQVNIKPDFTAGAGTAAEILNKPTDLTVLSNHAVTDLSDVTSAGSGAIITSAERNKLDSTHGTFIGLSTAERTKLTGIDVNTSTRVITDGTDSVTVPPADATATSTANVVAALTAGSNITISGGGVIAATDTDTNTTYDLTVHDSGDDAIIRLTGSDSTTDNVTLVAGNNVTLTPNSSNLTIDIDLTTAAVSNGSTSLVTGDHVFDYADPKFARKDQAETFSNNVTIQGDLTVSGTTTTVNTTELNIGDAIITLNSDLAAVTAPSENAGIEINRGSASDVALRWNEGTDKWEITEDGSSYGNISTVAQASDLSDVNITSVANKQVLQYNSSTSKWENSTDLDLAGGKALFGNVYSTTGDLPSASTYHGMFAHVHATGKGYFAHAGNWVELLDTASTTATKVAHISVTQAVDLDTIESDTATNNAKVTFPGFGTTAGTALQGNTQFVDGTGTAGTLPLFNDSDTLADSAISESGQVIDIDVNGAVKMPDGTTAQRPGSPSAGMFRYNTTDGQFEGYTTEWGAIAGSGSGGTSTILRNSFSGNGTTANFTLSAAVSDEVNTQVYVDGVYQSKLNYSTSGTTLTFSTAPPTGTNNIEVIHISSVALDSASTLNKNSFTGDGSQTAFTLSAEPTSEDFTFVFVQGVYQEKSTYSLSGTTLTFSTAPQNTYTIEVMSIGAVNVQQTNYLEYDSYTGTGSQTAFTLVNGQPTDEKFTMVFIQGVYQEKSTYSLAGGVITFALAPDSGYTIEIMSVSGAGVKAVPTVTANDVKYNVSVINSDTNASAGFVYVFTAGLTLTLPALPNIGDSIKISNRSSVTTCVLAANGNNIMGSSSNLTLDTASASFELIYSGATNGWVIIGQ